MSKGKKILIAVGYMLAFFVVPMLIILLFVSADSRVYVASFVFGIIFFLSFGIVISANLSQKYDLLTAIEELKVQNAALAFRLSENKKDMEKLLAAVDTTPLTPDISVGKSQTSQSDVKFNHSK